MDRSHSTLQDRFGKEIRFPYFLDNILQLRPSLQALSEFGNFHWLALLAAMTASLEIIAGKIFIVCFLSRIASKKMRRGERIILINSITMILSMLPFQLTSCLLSWRCVCHSKNSCPRFIYSIGLCWCAKFQQKAFNKFILPAVNPPALGK